MSLTDNARDVAFASDISIDKIVRTFTGSYSSGDLITRSGGFSIPYVYRFAHGLGRPVFCDLITSTDGGSTWDLGIGKLAFSDDTYIYIFHGYATTGTPVTYKVYCSWIDDYDNSNPLIETQTYSSQPILFDSRENYQKIAMQDVVSVTVGGSQSISHTLGYVPNAKVYIEAFSGEVWPLNFGGARNVFLYHGDQVEGEARIDSNSVDITLAGGIGSPATARVWYRIYYDSN